MYAGTFVRVEGMSYGFLKDVRPLHGEATPISGDVFLSGQAAALYLGRERHLLRRLDGKTVTFKVRPSARHPGKIEAWDVSTTQGLYPL